MAFHPRSLPLTLGDHEYRVVYGLLALRVLKHQYGFAKPLDLTDADFEDPDNVLGLLHAGLVHHHPDLTASEIERMVDLRDLARVLKTCLDALVLAMGREVPDDPPLAPETRRSSDGATFSESATVSAD